MATTISKQLAQQIVDTIHDVCGYNINFINTQGIIFASNDPDRIETYHEIGRQVALTGETIEVASDDNYPGTNRGINIPVYFHKRIIAVVGISGDPVEVRRYAHLAERISNILLHEQEVSSMHKTADEKKQYLLRSVINKDFENQEYLDECIHEFGIDINHSYRMVKIDLNTRYNLKNIAMLEQNIEALFRMFKNSLYTYVYPNHFMGILPEDSFSANNHLLKKFSEIHKDIVKIAIGKSAPFYKCSESWETAETAMDSLRGTSGSLVVFDDLTLEILLTGLPQNKVNEYASKVLSRLSNEDIKLLKTYYEENTSLQTTAEKLFLHKNTIQQRLNRIASTTGYNPRKFKDAVILYLAFLLHP
jgi:carbohydrate diacid regulator